MKLSAVAIFTIVLLINLVINFTVQAAGNYHIEVIVFDNINSGAYANTYEDNQTTALPSNGKTWRYSTAYLNSYASKLHNSSSYKVLQHIAWGQKSADYDHSVAKQLSGDGMNGWIKVYAKSLLFAQLDINFRGHKIKQQRRLKLNEVHYFDNDVFGVLLRVSRAKAE